MKLSKSKEERLADSAVWRKKFALFPTAMGDESVVWLESYEWREDYHTQYGPFDDVWVTQRRRCVQSLTNSRGAGASTEKQRNNIFPGGPG